MTDDAYTQHCREAGREDERPLSEQIEAKLAEASQRPDRLAVATTLLRQFMSCLPTRRDWLDPDVETATKRFLASKAPDWSVSCDILRDALRLALEDVPERKMGRILDELQNL